MQVTGAISVFCWIKCTGTNQTIAGKWNTTGNQRSWNLILNGATGNKLQVTLSANGSANAKDYYGGTTLNDNAWHHVGFTYDGNNTLKLYVDGAEESVTKTTDTSITAIHNSTSKMALGAQNATNPAVYFVGSMDEFTLHGKALTATEAANLRTYGAWPLRGGLRAWYRCGDGDTYPTLTDNSGNGNDGTMTNMESGDIQTADPSISNFQSEGDTWVVVE